MGKLLKNYLDDEFDLKDLQKKIKKIGLELDDSEIEALFDNFKTKDKLKCDYLCKSVD